MGGIPALPPPDTVPEPPIALAPATLPPAPDIDSVSSSVARPPHAAAPARTSNADTALIEREVTPHLEQEWCRP